jgi:hypothetical protein
MLFDLSSETCLNSVTNKIKDPKVKTNEMYLLFIPPHATINRPDAMHSAYNGTIQRRRRSAESKMIVERLSISGEVKGRRFRRGHEVYLS